MSKGDRSGDWQANKMHSENPKVKIAAFKELIMMEIILIQGSSYRSGGEKPRIGGSTYYESLQTEAVDLYN